MEIIMYGLLGLAAIVPATFFVFYIVAYDRYKPEPVSALVVSVLLGMMAAYDGRDSDGLLHGAGQEETTDNEQSASTGVACTVNGTICFLAMMVVNNWTYFLMKDIVLFVLGILFYIQIYRLLKNDGIRMKRM